MVCGGIPLEFILLFCFPIIRRIRRNRSAWGVVVLACSTRVLFCCSVSRGTEQSEETVQPVPASGVGVYSAVLIHPVSVHQKKQHERVLWNRWVVVRWNILFCCSASHGSRTIRTIP